MTDKLRQFLQDRAMTQRELAAKLGMSEEYISRLMNEKSPVTSGFKGQFANVFGFDVAAQVFNANGHAEPEAQPE